MGAVRFGVILATGTVAAAACGPHAPPAMPHGDPVGPPAIAVVYPRLAEDSTGALVSAFASGDSAFVFGSVRPPHAVVTVNGTSVDVAPTGAWLAWIPLPDDTVAVIAVHATVAGQADSLAFLATLPRRFEAPDSGAWIDTTSLGPTGDVWVRPGEGVRLAVRAAPGATLRVLRADSSPVAVLVPEYDGEGRAWGELAFGTIPGVLRGTFWGMAGLALIGVALGVLAARWVKVDTLGRHYPFRWLSADARSSVLTLLHQFQDGLRTLRDPELAVPAIVVSVVAWMLEAGAYWMFGEAFGLNLSWSAYLLIMMTANFVVSIPITPSGIGPYEVATQALVVGLGADAALATGYAIGIHLVFIIWITLTGLVAMWLTHLSPREIFYLAQEPAEATPQPEAT